MARDSGFMANCRSISDEGWAQAREALVFYFSRRHGVHEAEDLAQEALAALLTREDYEFEREEDFLRVCYGFARLISQKGYRQSRKHAGDELSEATPAGSGEHGSPVNTEMRILLGEVVRLARAALPVNEWQLIHQAAVTDRATLANELNLGDANNVRVRLHRYRKKLAHLTGWRKNRV